MRIVGKSEYLKDGSRAVRLVRLGNEEGEKRNGEFSLVSAHIYMHWSIALFLIVEDGKIGKVLTMITSRALDNI